MIFRIFYSNEQRHVTATIGERHRFSYNMFSAWTQWNRTIVCGYHFLSWYIHIFLFSFSQIEEIVGHRVNILITCVVQAIYMNKSGSMPQYVVQRNAPRSYNRKPCQCASREEFISCTSTSMCMAYFYHMLSSIYVGYHSCSKILILYCVFLPNVTS